MKDKSLVTFSKNHESLLTTRAALLKGTEESSTSLLPTWIQMCWICCTMIQDLLTFLQVMTRDKPITGRIREPWRVLVTPHVQSSSHVTMFPPSRSKSSSSSCLSVCRSAETQASFLTRWAAAGCEEWSCSHVLIVSTRPTFVLLSLQKKHVHFYYASNIWGGGRRGEQRTCEEKGGEN